MDDGLKRAAEAAANTKTRRAGLFGKQPAKIDPRTLRFSAVLAPALPAPPPSFDALQRVKSGLKLKSLNVGALFPMDGNDSRGDCTIAAAAHAETLWEAFCGKRRVPKGRDVLRDYFDLTGGEDSGLVELDVLNRWRQAGITGERILAYAAIDRSNLDHVRQAIFTFGGVYIGFAVQQNCISDFNHHRTWTAGPLTNEGHAVFVAGYTPGTFTCLTWGSKQNTDLSWWNECVDEVYAVLPGEASLQAFAPGLNLDALETALQQVAA